MRKAVGLAILALALTAATAALARPLMTRSQAAKLARSSNLRAGDVPGYDMSRATQEPGTDLWGGRRYAQCTNRKDFGKELADVLSPSFEHDSPGQFDALGSEVMVEPNASYASKDLSIAKSSLGQRCLKREMTRLKPQGVNLDSFGGSRLSGFNNGVAYRIKMVVTTSDGTKVPIYADVIAFAERQVEGSVFFISGPNPPSRATENHLVDTVQTRIDKQVYKNDIV